MSQSHPPQSSAAKRSASYRQVGLVCLLAVGLVAAAFVAPSVGEFQEPEPSACSIETDGELIPGTDVEITVISPEGPVADVPVELSGEPIGTTDDNGTLETTVPYQYYMDLTADVSDYPECEANRLEEVGETAQDDASANNTVEPPVETAALGAPSPLQVGNVASADTTSEFVPTNATVMVAAPEAADPGEEVEITANVSGVPLEEATVATVPRPSLLPLEQFTDISNRDPIGETDENGTATVSLPADSEQVILAVGRGDIEGFALVDLRLLSASFADDGLILPGDTATVEALEGSDPAADASVEIDGEQVGTTDADGQATVELPQNPFTPITVHTDSQSTSVSLAGYYAGGIGLTAVAGVVLLIATGLAAWARGLRGVLTLYGLLAIPVGVALAYWQFDIRTAVGLAFALTALAVGFWLTRPTADGRPRATTLGERLTRILVALAGRLEALATGVGRLLARFVRWLSAQPRSLRTIARRFRHWLFSLPGTTRRLLIQIRWRAVFGGLSLPLVVGAGFAIDGPTGAAVTALGVGPLYVLAVGYWWVRRRSSEREGSDGEPDLPEPSLETPTQADPVTDLWQAFATQVDPTHWQHRTPEEIERAAVSKGYPTEAVNRFTSLFCEITYGHRPTTVRTVDRARAVAQHLLEDANADTVTHTDGGEPQDDDRTGDGGSR